MVWLLRGIFYVQALVLGFGSLILAWEPALVSDTIAWWHAYFSGDYLVCLRIFGIAFGALQLLTLLALALRWWRANRFAREVTYHTEHGQVSVSLLAIEEALGRALENEDGVRRVHIRVREDRVRRCMVIEADLTLWEVANVNQFNRSCQDLLRQRFNELMPEKSVVQIELKVHSLRQRRPERRQGDTRRRTGVSELGVEAPVLTPALAATRGQTSNLAGRELLSHSASFPRQPDLEAGAAALAAARRRRESSVSEEAVRELERRRSSTASQEPTPIDRSPVIHRFRPRGEEESASDVQVRSPGAQLQREQAAGPYAEEALEASTSIAADAPDQREARPASVNTMDDGGEEVFDDLYFGPTYPVTGEEDDEVDYSGRPLPAEKPPSRQIKKVD